MTAKQVLSLYLLAATLVACFLIFAAEIANDYNLKKNGMKVNGIVVQSSCERHLTFSYRFEVNKKSFTGTSSSTECYKVKPGEIVTIHYLANNPMENTAGNPEYVFKNNVYSIALASLGIPSLLILLIWIKSRKA